MRWRNSRECCVSTAKRLHYVTAAGTSLIVRLIFINFISYANLSYLLDWVRLVDMHWDFHDLPDFIWNLRAMRVSKRSFT